MNNPEATAQALENPAQRHHLPVVRHPHACAGDLQQRICPAELQAHRRAGAVRGALVLRDYGLVQYFSGHALWTVPEGTAFLLLVGVGVELSLMFSIAGLVMSNFLPRIRR